MSYLNSYQMKTALSQFTLQSRRINFKMWKKEYMQILRLTQNVKRNIHLKLHHLCIKVRSITFQHLIAQGLIQRFWKVVALYVGHHGRPMKKILGFRWSKKAKITLETKTFGETFLSVFSNFLHFYI